jgi:dihydrolipoamide dehydrogenase
MYDFDLAIIGGGPGGYVAAIKSAQLGLKTVLIEKDEVGGTCLNVGCIPTKTMVKNAEIIHELKHASTRGIKVDGYEVDMKASVKMKNGVVSQLTDGIKMLLTYNGVKVINGEAEVLTKNTLVVDDKEISFDKLIIATGSSNFIPPVEGLDDEGILTSTEILDIDHVPEKLVIIGGGVIGCEFATIFNNFGSQVTIVEMLPNIVPMMDKDVSTTLNSCLTSDGVKIMTNHKVTKVSKANNKYLVEVSGVEDEVIEADKVLVSVGRRSNLKGLEKLGLDLERNYIKINNQLETNIEGVYAIGDVTGKIQLAHVASAQGIIAAENISGKIKKISYDVVPSCIYTIPEIGSVGLTEEQAKEKYGEILVGRFPMMASGKAIAMGAVRGFTKLIADKNSRKVVGCHIIGPNATEVVGQAAIHMQKNGTIDEITETIHAHPTITETVLEAAHLALGEPIHTV